MTTVIIVGLTVFIKNTPHIQEIELDSNYNELFTKEELKEKGHISLISEYSTDVATAYMNKDGSKTLYIYASPIRYYSNGQLSMIDTRLANVSDTIKNSGYPYTIANSDIKPFFPLQLSKNKGIKIRSDMEDIEYEISPDSNKEIKSKVITRSNFIGESKMQVAYENALGSGIQMNFYPSSLGTNCEIMFNTTPKTTTFSLWLTIPDISIKVEKEPDGYLVLTKNGIGLNGMAITKIVGVIQKPLLKLENGDISYNSSINFSKVDDKCYQLRFELDKNFLTKGCMAFISFEMRREKQPDTALYSGLPDLKYSYLTNYSVIGNSKKYGIGRLMIRYVFVKNFNLQSNQIDEAYYYTYNLNNQRNQFELLSVLDDWCGMTGNWNSNYKTGGKITELSQGGQELKFNITEKVKKWCNDLDGQMEHNGIQLKSVEENDGKYSVLLSNDNTLYRNRTEVLLKYQSKNLFYERSVFL